MRSSSSRCCGTANRTFEMPSPPSHSKKWDSFTSYWTFGRICVAGGWVKTSFVMQDNRIGIWGLSFAVWYYCGCVDESVANWLWCVTTLWVFCKSRDFCDKAAESIPNGSALYIDMWPCISEWDFGGRLENIFIYFFVLVCHFRTQIFLFFLK